MHACISIVASRLYDGWDCMIPLQIPDVCITFVCCLIFFYFIPKENYMYIYYKIRSVSVRQIYSQGFCWRENSRRHFVTADSRSETLGKFLEPYQITWLRQITSFHASHLRFPLGAYWFVTTIDYTVSLNETHTWETQWNRYLYVSPKRLKTKLGNNIALKSFRFLNFQLLRLE